MDVAEGCLTMIFVEFSFWIIAGFLSLILYTVSNSTVILVLSFIILLIIAHLIDSKYSRYICITCNESFSKPELKESHKDK